MNCAADATDVVFLERKRRKGKSARELFLDVTDPERRDLSLGRNGRTWLMPSTLLLDVARRRRTVNVIRTPNIGEVKRARSLSKKSRGERTHGETRSLFDGKYGIHIGPELRKTYILNILLYYFEISRVVARFTVVSRDYFRIKKRDGKVTILRYFIRKILR